MTAAGTRFETPYGSFKLQRYPARRAEPLQAWCAADSLLLQEVQQRAVSRINMLVVNDDHGALCVALQPQALWTDSALAVQALQHNESVNERTPTPVLWSDQIPAFAPDFIVLRIPKQLPFFEYQLSRLALWMAPGTTLLVAGMDKHLSSRTAKILERHIGPTQRHRGQHKARLFSAVRDERPAVTIDDTSGYVCASLDGELRALPNVFSRDKLDQGSRFLVAYMDTLSPAETVIDLACGNGVLGLVAFKQGLAKSVIFCDESAMAIASAQNNASTLFPQQTSSFAFHQGDGLLGYTGAPAELILCNPPFHLNHTVDEFAGRHLLDQCGQYLHANGRLCLVANRHLDYLPTLKRRFGRVEKAASNEKFTIWLAHKN